MRRYTMFAFVSLALAGCSTQANMADAETQPSTSGRSAGATLIMADGQQIGTATLTEDANGFTTLVVVRGLKPGGEHGLHIHTIGQCDGPDFTSAGGHWNPTAMKHGRDNPSGPHMGDLPNLKIDADGTGRLQFTTANARLRTGEKPLLDADGASIVLHAGADDYRTDPAGDSGGRVACGVIQPIS